MFDEVSHWLLHRLTRGDQADRQRLARLAREQQQRISVVLPARNEQATVGVIVQSFVEQLQQACPLVHEVIVIDSGSTDDTFSVARSAGAQVYRQRDILPQCGDRPGKGEALWKSLAVATGDIIVFCDADLLDVNPQLIVGLVEPLLDHPDVHFVKACYDRPLHVGAAIHTGAGGRVTELVARPLLNMFWPALSGFVQPLAGEYAVRRDTLLQLPFAGRYAVEIAMLIDVWQRHGLAAMAQVDSGERHHRNSADHTLGVMAMEIQGIVFDRLRAHNRLISLDEPVSELVQFDRVRGDFAPRVMDCTVRQRQPMSAVLAAVSREDPVG